MIHNSFWATWFIILLVGLFDWRSLLWLVFLWVAVHVSSKIKTRLCILRFSHFCFTKKKRFSNFNFTKNQILRFLNFNFTKKQNFTIFEFLFYKKSKFYDFRILQKTKILLLHKIKNFAATKIQKFGCYQNSKILLLPKFKNFVVT